MIPYIIVSSSFLICYILITVYLAYHKKKLVYEEIEQFCIQNKYLYKISNSKKYDIEISNDSFVMYIKLCFIPKNSSVTINSKSTWCLRFGGGTRKGRNYPNKRYLNELVPFLNSNLTSEKETFRVVIFCPSTEVILKYVNESDIVEVKPSQSNYGIKAIKYTDFISKFDELLIKNNK